LGVNLIRRWGIGRYPHKNLEGGVSPNPQVLSTSYEKKYLGYNPKHLLFAKVCSITMFPKFDVGKRFKLNSFNKN
jgi:hypothetical protein